MVKVGLLALDVGGSFVKVLVDLFEMGKEEKIFFKFHSSSFKELENDLERIYSTFFQNCYYKILISSFAGRILQNGEIVSITKWREVKRAKDIFKKLNFDKRIFKNDIECAMVSLDNSKFKTIKRGKVSGDSKALVYLGSGMGVALSKDGKIYPSEFASSSFTLDFENNLEKKIYNKKIFTNEDILSSNGILFISEKLGYKVNDLYDVIKKVREGKLKKVATLFSTFLGRSLRNLVLTTLSETIILGGKPLDILLPECYKDMTGEFLNDDNSRWYLKDVEIKRILKDEDMPLKGAEMIGLKILKEMRVV